MEMVSHKITFKEMNKRVKQGSVKGKRKTRRLKRI